MAPAEVPQALLDQLDVEACLRPTPFMDAGDAAVRHLATGLCASSSPPEERAAAAVRFVRDEVRYELRLRLDREAFVASSILAEGKGFCLRKAVLLGALARALGVPVAIVLCDLRDLTLSPALVRALGTDVLHFHGLNGLHIGGRWLLVDASLSPDVLERKGCAPVPFDGTDHALLAPWCLDGAPHVEYVRFHGAHSDIPFATLLESFAQVYRSADALALMELGLLPIARPRGDIRNGRG